MNQPSPSRPLSPALVPFDQASEDFREGRDSPRAYLERTLERLEAWEPRLRAFASLGVDGARAAADEASRRWSSGRPLSSIDGMPVGIKDVIDTADLPTELGMEAYAGHRPRVDAAAVFGLREAGAVILGKTATTEFAMTHPAETRNPHDLERTPGGSSSGSAAAVGAGILPAALGTQAIGSVLRPASFCGAFGYKPTLGAINRGGSHDTQSQSAIGVIGASLADVWRPAWEIVARVGGDPGSPGLYGEARPAVAAAPATVVHLETEGWSAATPAAREQVAEMLDRVQQAGVRVLHRHNDDQVAGFEERLVGVLARGRAIINVESAWPLRPIARQAPQSLSPTLRERMRVADGVTPDDYRALLDWRRQLRDDYAELMGRADAVVTLAAAGAAPRGLTATGDAALTVPASVLGAPALSLPVLQDDGLPLGLQVVAGRHQDTRLFATAAWLLDLSGATAPLEVRGS